LEADGSFSPAPTQEIAYATLVGERVYLLYFLLADAACAVTIATRFSAARLQGPSDESLLFYQSHQTRLMPIIAGLYAMRTVAVAQEDQWVTIQGGLSEGKEIEFLLSVQELHATSAGMKAWCSWWCADAIEQARRAMGGHSFSQHSGIPTIQGDFGVHTQGRVAMVARRHTARGPRKNREINMQY
jgi:acyl-CoA oxidase